MFAAAPAAFTQNRTSKQHRLKRHFCATTPRHSQLTKHTTRHRRSVSVTAFKGQHSDVVNLPLDYYKVLTVGKASSPAMVKRAYDRQLRSPPDVGFSQDTLFYRAVLLRDAAECLQNYSSRKKYDAMAHEGTGYSVDVSLENLPAALVLLQESGDSQLVINVGSEWLQSNGMDPLARDVAAAVALAHCDEAAEALEQNSTVVLKACQNLEVSLQLLRKHKMAPQLQQQIMQTLEDYSPRYCLELLALPLEPSFTRQRQRGRTLLRKLVFDLPQDLSPVSQQERNNFLSTAISLLTPQETLDFYSTLSAAVTLNHQQRLQVALATVAVGYLQHQPGTVQQAAKALAQLQQGPADGSQIHDLSVDRAGCALMLGNTQQAQDLLFVNNETSRAAQQDKSDGEDMQTDESIKAFVLEHSPDPSDLLPGLYVLTESWLQEAVMASFRQDTQTTQEPVSLRAWFKAKPVQWYIQVFAVLRSINLLKAVEGTFTAVLGMISWILGRIPTMLTGNKGTSADDSPSVVMQTSSAQLQSIGLKQQQQQQQQQHAHQVQQPPLPSTASQHQSEQQLPDVEQMTATLVDSEQQQLPEQELNVSWLRQHLRKTGPHASNQGIDNQGGAAEQMKQLKALEAAMWDSEPVLPDGRWVLLGKALAVLLVASAAAYAYYSRSNGTTAPAIARSADIWRVLEPGC